MSFEKDQHCCFGSWGSNSHREEDYDESSSSSSPSGDNSSASDSSENHEEVRDIQWSFYSIDRPDDIVESKEAVCQEISKLLGQIVEDGGAYSFSGELDELLVLPGLSVNGFGGASLPLCKEQAKLLVNQGVEEGNVWTLFPFQVEITNSQWGQAIQKLSKLSADRLSFKDIDLQPILPKVVVYGEGG